MMPAEAYVDILNSPFLTRLVLFQASESEKCSSGEEAREVVPLSSDLLICGIIGGHVTHSHRFPCQDI